ncbi:MAG: DUF1499 domain-containing protein [Planctomycetota bacterium]
MILRWTVGVAAVMILLPVIAFALLSLFSRKPDNLGVKDGKLAPCPNSPNCVSTQASDTEHQIEPFAYKDSKEETVARLKGVVAAMPRAKIVTETGDYVHAEFTSFLFRFVDDVEFFFDDGTRTVQFRSASRVGHSDLGVNAPAWKPSARRTSTEIDSAKKTGGHLPRRKAMPPLPIHRRRESRLALRNFRATGPGITRSLS